MSKCGLLLTFCWLTTCCLGCLNRRFGRLLLVRCWVWWFCSSIGAQHFCVFLGVGSASFSVMLELLVFAFPAIFRCLGGEAGVCMWLCSMYSSASLFGDWLGCGGFPAFPSICGTVLCVFLWFYCGFNAPCILPTRISLVI